MRLLTVGNSFSRNATDQTHSLHVGSRWVKRPDGHHANRAGEYLGGCVFYELLTETSVVGNPFVQYATQRSMREVSQ